MKRKNILICVVLSFSIIIIGSGVAWKFSSTNSICYIKEKSFNYPKISEKEKNKEILSEKELDFIKEVYKRLKCYSKTKKTAHIIEISDLFPPYNIEKETKIPVVSLVCLGKNKFAVIDGKIYKKGDKLPDGSIVKLITFKGVVIKKDKKLILLPWTMPEKVMFLDLSKSTIKEGKNVQGSKALETPENIKNIFPHISNNIK